MSRETIRFCECGRDVWTADYYCAECGEPYFPNAKPGSRLRPAETEGN